MEIPAALTDAQIRDLPADAAFLKNVIADRERRLAKARQIYRDNEKKLALVDELQQFKDMIEEQGRRMQKMFDDGFCDPLPDDIKLTRNVRACLEQYDIEKGKRAAIQSMLDRVRLMWSNGLIGGPVHESEAWKTLLSEICEEADDARRQREPAPF